jgi:flavin-dependent dehydrogenase
VEGPTGGDIVVVTTPDGWWWLIPFSDGSVSVGIVMPSRRFKERSGSVEQLFEESVAGTPEVRDLLSGSKRTMDVHAIADYSYSTPRISGDGFCLVGDAACFLDPVFSSGVLLAMESAELAASSVDRALRSKGRVDAADFRDFEKIYRRAVDGVAPMLFAASGIRRLAHEVKGAGDGAAATTLEEPREADKLTRSVVLEGIDVKHEKVARARSG